MKCKICSGLVTTFFDPRMGCDTYHCEACQFIFKDAAAYVAPDRELKQYNQHNNTIDSPGYVEMFEAYIERCITPYKSRIETVLEFGSGPGPVLSQLLEKHGFHVEIYDKFFSPEPVYEGKQYDLITATEVIEHIDDPVGIMRFFHTHLKPGGYLALMTQFHTNEIATYLKWWYRADPTHICFFRPETFKVLGDISSFSVIDADPKKLVVLRKQ